MYSNREYDKPFFSRNVYRRKRLTLIEKTIVSKKYKRNLENWYNSLQKTNIEIFTGFLVTILLAFSFTLLQLYEYLNASFSISDSVYGSTFFMLTGFHGFHVIVGTIFLVVCFFRFLNYHFTDSHHLGFEAAAWYWHFVDVVWLFLLISVYWWGNWN